LIGILASNLFRSGASHSRSSSRGIEVVPVVIAVVVALGLMAVVVHWVARAGRSPTPPPRRPERAPSVRTRPGMWDDTVDGPFFS
jgi:hypothetical protein